MDLAFDFGHAAFYDEVIAAMSMSPADALLKAKDVVRQEAREGIREVIARLAGIDGLAEAEARLLKSLDVTWR